MSTSRTSVGPLYRTVQKYLLDRIQDGELKPTDRVPSENELVKLLGVSRMTVNRAVRELSDQGILERIPGVGTFVAEHRAQGHLLEVRNIADEIHERGHRHRSRLLSAAAEVPPPDTALGLHLAPGKPAYHSVIVHYENHRPIQLEDRWVHPVAAPGYLQMDFKNSTPSEYLQEVAPLKRVEHVVQAVMPDQHIRRELELPSGEPCLLLLRRTWSNGVVASTARLYYPGASYQLGDRFQATSS